MVAASRAPQRLGGDLVPAVIRRTPRGRSHGAPPYEHTADPQWMSPVTPRGGIKVHSATEVHSMADDVDEPMDATKVLNMVSNDMSVQNG